MADIVSHMCVNKYYALKVLYLNWEVALHLPQEVVYLLAPILVNRGTDGPDKAKDEPELHHPTHIFCVRSIHLRKE